MSRIVNFDEYEPRGDLFSSSAEEVPQRGQNSNVGLRGDGRNTGLAGPAVPRFEQYTGRGDVKPQTGYKRQSAAGFGATRPLHVQPSDRVATNPTVLAQPARSRQPTARSPTASPSKQGTSSIRRGTGSSPRSPSTRPPQEPGQTTSSSWWGLPSFGGSSSVEQTKESSPASAAPNATRQHVTHKPKGSATSATKSLGSPQARTGRSVEDAGAKDQGVVNELLELANVDLDVLDKSSSNAKKGGLGSEPVPSQSRRRDAGEPENKSDLLVPPPQVVAAKRQAEPISPPVQNKDDGPADQRRSTEAHRPTPSLQPITASPAARLRDFYHPHAASLRVPKVNILLFGAAGSGRSSFINALVTCLAGDESIHYRAPIGGSSGGGALPDVSQPDRHSHYAATTKHFERYDVTKSVVLWDTWGWNAAKDADSDAVANALDGDQFAAMLAGALPSQWPMRAPLADLAVESGSLASAMHGAICFVPVDRVSRQDRSYLETAAKFVRQAQDVGIQPIVVLSKCDRLEARLDQLDSSPAVADARKDAARQLGVPLNTVYPCKTYFAEFRRDFRIDQLVEAALRGALVNAAELLRRKYNQAFQDYGDDSTVSPGSSRSNESSFFDRLMASAPSDRALQLSNNAGGRGRAASRSDGYGVQGVGNLVDVDDGEDTLLAIEEGSLARRAQVWLDSRFKLARRWSEFLHPTNYSHPQSWEHAGRRLLVNFQFLSSNYGIALVFVFLAYALYHITSRPFLFTALVLVVCGWLIAFRLIRRPVPVKCCGGFHFTLTHRLKEVTFIVVVIGVISTLFWDVGVNRVLIMLTLATPVIVCHAIFYHRMELIQPIDNKGI